MLFTSCEINSDQPGPRGAEGPAGLDGLIGTVFEVQVDFTSSNDFKFLAPFPSDLEVFESDVVAAYVLKTVDEGVDIWEPLPQTIFYNNNILLYGFDHSYKDINFFIDGTMDLGMLPATFTDGYTFRVVIIPAAYAKTINLNSMDAILETLKPTSIERIN